MVIIGGGVIGTSVAYHLAELGCTDVLLLEQASCHAAPPGTRPGWSASSARRRAAPGWSMLHRAVHRLEAETRLSTGFRRCGGLVVARAADRLTQLRRTAAAADTFGLAGQLLSPAPAGRRYPLIDTADLAARGCRTTAGPTRPT